MGKWADRWINKSIKGQLTGWSVRNMHRDIDIPALKCNQPKSRALNDHNFTAHLEYIRRVESKIDSLLNHLGLEYVPEKTATKPAEIVKKSKLAKDGRK